jgi:ribose/xylose/arabinose/galactoside ABC-type transport system permease subunit
MARVAALVLCSAIAAVVGVFMCAQGIRDNTYVPLTFYLIVIPLAGLVVGGQHILRGWQRPLGAIIGALLIAAICVKDTQPSDNLAPAAITAVMLVALFLSSWGFVTGSPHWARRRVAMEAASSTEDDLQQKLYVA